MDEIERLKKIFSSDFKIVSHSEHISGRHTFTAECSDGSVAYVTYYPKWEKRINIDIYKGETDANVGSAN